MVTIIINMGPGKRPRKRHRLAQAWVMLTLLVLASTITARVVLWSIAMAASRDGLPGGEITLPASLTVNPERRCGMKINTLRLENFQGIKAATFDFKGQSASVYGDNATGKTTLFNALTWLLFDRPSTGAKGYTPKTKGPDGDVHYLDHAAEAQFTMDGGRLVTLRKVFHENYKKKRGSATEEFDGHSVDFFIDGVPVKEKEYTAALLGFCGGAEQMKMLTMPHYFPEDMPWEARRKILLEVCGDVTDTEVIASNGELGELPTYLLMPGTADQHYTVDEYKKIAAAQKADINKQLLGIPGRIDEAQRAIPEETIDVAAIDAQLSALQTKQDGLMEQKAALLAGDTATAEARKRVAAAEAALAEARTAHLNRAAEANQGTQASITALQGRISTAMSGKYHLRAELDRQNMNLERLQGRRADLLQEYASIQAETWDEGQAVCPTCHRELPAEDVTRMREAFNIGKSNRLQSVNQQGQREASKEMIEGLQAQIAGLQTEFDAAEAELKNLTDEQASLQAKLVAPTPFEQTTEYASLAAAVAASKAAEAGAGQTTTTALEALNAQIQAVYAESRELQQQKGKADQAEAQRKRIAELQDQEKALSAQYEELEKGIYLCEQFTKAKVRMLTDRINGKFKNVRFRLFLEQVNGGVKDDCEVLVPNEAGSMVPFRDANNAARINAGLEIIETLAYHWGISMPVFIDNAESVTRLAHTAMQTVRLVVSDQDAKLRLELNDAKGGAAA